MKKLFTIAAASTICISQALAGIVYILPPANGDEESAYGENLNNVTSIQFSKIDLGNSNEEIVVNPGKKPAFTEALDKIYTIDFDVLDKTSETMTIKGNGVHGEFTDKIDLKDIAVIRVVSFEDKDSDCDGLSDFDEIYKYETNPKNPDTDGDGFSDYDEVMKKIRPDWDPKVANLPELVVELVGFPELYLKKTSTSGTTETESITKGASTSEGKTVNISNTHSSTVQLGWSTNVNNEWSLAANGGYKIGVNVGHSGYNSNVNGSTVSTTNQETMTKNYSEAVSNAASKSETISGGRIRVRAKLTNKSLISYNIENLSLELSAFTAIEGVKVIAEAKHVDNNGSVVNTVTTLKPGEAIEMLFDDGSVPRSTIDQFVRNPGAIFLSAAAKKITFSDNTTYSTNTDFTGIYTSVQAQTATITIDYGPETETSEATKVYHVAPNFRLNERSVSATDIYKSTSLKEILDIINLNYETGKGSKYEGLTSLNGHKYNRTSQSEWFIWMRKASAPNIEMLYSTKIASYDIDSIMVDAGDELHLYYNTDQDDDKIPLQMEVLLGTDDKKVDSDGDNISDYDEINGWNGYGAKDKTIIYHTNPAMADTDLDGMNDNVDDDPINKKLGTDADLDIEHMYVNGLAVRVPEGAKGTLYAGTFNGSTAKLKFSTVNSVGSVKLVNKQNSQETILTPITDNPKDYETTIPGIAIGENLFDLITTSENGQNTKTYSLKIISDLPPIKSIALNRNESRDAILVDYTSNSDDRIQGYIILRVNAEDADNAKSFRESFEMKPTTEQPVAEKTLGNGVVIAGINKVDDSKPFIDSKVAAGPYYIYRVVSYTKQGDSYIFSQPSTFAEKSVGNIKVTYSLQAIGGKAYGTAVALGFLGARNSPTITTQLKTKNNENIYTYPDYTIWQAGHWNHPYTMIWETNADDISISLHQDNDYVPIETTEHEFILPADGFKLNLKSHNQNYGDNVDYGTYEQTISWTFQDFKDALDGKSPASKAPANGEITSFQWGETGIGVNEAVDNCTSCGDEPHNGVKMIFKYKYVND